MVPGEGDRKSVEMTRKKVRTFWWVVWDREKQYILPYPPESTKKAAWKNCRAMMSRSKARFLVCRKLEPRKVVLA